MICTPWQIVNHAILNMLGVLIALTQFNMVSRQRLPSALLLDQEEIFNLISSDQFCSPERDSNRGLSRIGVFKDGKATALTTQPLRLGYQNIYFV